MINIGIKMSFVPSWNEGRNDDEATTREKTVTGRVVYVDRAHKKFTVKYSCGGVQMKETFKMSDIGQAIHRVEGRKNGC